MKSIILGSMFAAIAAVSNSYGEVSVKQTDLVAFVGKADSRGLSRYLADKEAAKLAEEAAVKECQQLYSQCFKVNSSSSLTKRNEVVTGTEGAGDYQGLGAISEASRVHTEVSYEVASTVVVLGMK